MKKRPGLAHFFKKILPTTFNQLKLFSVWASWSNPHLHSSGCYGVANVHGPTPSYRRVHHSAKNTLFFIKWAHPGIFLFIFVLLKQNFTEKL